MQEQIPIRQPHTPTATRPSHPPDSKHQDTEEHKNACKQLLLRWFTVPSIVDDDVGNDSEYRNGTGGEVMADRPYDRAWIHAGVLMKRRSGHCGCRSGIGDQDFGYNCLTEHSDSGAARISCCVVQDTRADADALCLEVLARLRAASTIRVRR